jgi:hypothetical protein
MSTLRAILEIRGCLDTAVVTTQDPRVMEIADAFLPDTSANQEWYREIEAFMFLSGARTDADPVHALTEFLERSAAEQRRPTAPEASRFIYGLGAVIHLTQTVPIDVLPFDNLLAEDSEERALLAEVFALTGPDEPGNTPGFHFEQLDAVGQLFAEKFPSWRQWILITPDLVRLKILTPEAASVPLCAASVVTVDGIESVVVDAELSSDKVSLNDLKAVVDPRNWHKDYPSFFCDMKYKGLRPDGWRTVLETVGFCYYPTSISRRLVTMLKFYKTTVNSKGPGRSEARLDYDLNDPVPDPDGDGTITVDRGFINMWTGPNGDPDQPPVFARTRKVCHIEGLRPYTMKRFVCDFAYARIVDEMLFGSALAFQAGDRDFVGWDDPADEQPGGKVDQPKEGKGEQPKKKPPSDNSVASTAISMVAKCVQELTVKQFDLADKWMSGQLTVQDLAQHSAEVGARIASDPWKFIHAISRPKGGGK